MTESDPFILGAKKIGFRLMLMFNILQGSYGYSNSNG